MGNWFVSGSDRMILNTEPVFLSIIKDWYEMVYNVVVLVIIYEMWKKELSTENAPAPAAYFPSLLHETSGSLTPWMMATMSARDTRLEKH